MDVLVERNAWHTNAAIDGTTLRIAMGNAFTGRVHLASAWATVRGLILGQEAVAERPNEISDIPGLWKTCT